VLCAGPASSTASQPATGLGQQQFSKEVEDEANSYFQRIYNTSGSSQHSAITIVEQVLEMLKNFKDSPSERDKVRTSSLFVSCFRFVEQGVGKVRPAGQIWPASSVDPVRPVSSRQTHRRLAMPRGV